MPPLYLIYWVLVIVAFLGGGYINREQFGSWAGNNFLYLVLFIIIGIKIFGGEGGK